MRSLFFFVVCLALKFVGVYNFFKVMVFGKLETGDAMNGKAVIAWDIQS